MSDDTITSLDVAPKKEPTAFKDLNKAQLEAAVDYFGADRGSVKEMRASLVENGVEWNLYAEAFLGPKREPDVEGFVLSEPTDIEDWPDTEGVEEVNEVLTQVPVPQLAPQQKYLIKMTRKNPYFEFEDKKFTQERPYAIMDAAQAQRVLESEDGFRQAYPAELEEFYG